jgi:hypothetical protein
MSQVFPSLSAGGLSHICSCELTYPEGRIINFILINNMRTHENVREMSRK